MRSFLNFKDNMDISAGIAWLIGKCMEARGKQDLWLKTRPEIMKSLKETAMIQSAESSNRIEGVEVDSKRLKPLLAGKVKPVDRPEEEVLGYQKALMEIHKKYSKIDISPETILKLHKLTNGHSWDAGKWKEKDNEIIEIMPNGEKKIRFKAVSAKDTPKAIEQLCLSYKHELSQHKIPELILISDFILDFLCIHPFRDGNGRASRLLTLLMLYQNGYEVGRYISIERVIENSKDQYYRVLQEASNNWHENKNAPITWRNYFLVVLKDAYSELAERVEMTKTLDNKSEIVKQIVMSQMGEFTVADIQSLCPATSYQLIKKVLSDLKKEKKLLLSGSGRGAKWKISK
jgi:Fic family protein